LTVKYPYKELPPTKDPPGRQYAAVASLPVVPADYKIENKLPLTTCLRLDYHRAAFDAAIIPFTPNP